MKKSWFILPIILLIIPFAFAEDNPYLYDSLKIQLDMEGYFDLIAERESSRTEEVSVQLLLYPVEDYRQEIAGLNHRGERRDQTIYFHWEEPSFGRKEFGYTALVWTNDQRQEVRRKISFPPENIQEYQQYLQPTETIDSDHPKIIAKASELAEGEDDLFQVAFNIADWVERNVDYDLTTLTAGTSQKASWVLENRQGVCDEMTSLFVAMMRSLGIPARFVSGVSYSTSDLFTDPWQPHGWAEVYFPEVGWVSFDITFGEYGYVDVTHIKLRDGFDPQEAATKYEWVASRVELETGELKIETEIKNKGSLQPSEIELKQDILAKEIDFGSYNLIKGSLRNLKNYYSSATLKLAVPAEAEIQGRNKRTILLPPGETKETYWIVKVEKDLDPKYNYRLPVVLYTEKGFKVEESFSVQNGKMFYSEEDIEKLIISNEEKTYSRKINFDCDYQEEINLGEEMEISCRVHNAGNTNLNGINFCLKGVCEIVDLPINQKKSLSVTVRGEKPGWEKVVISAENGLIEKKNSLDYSVQDVPRILMTMDFPQEIRLGEVAEGKIRLEKQSFSSPQKVKLKVRWLGTENLLETDALNTGQTFSLNLPSERLSWKNKAEIKVSWEDRQGNVYSEEKEAVIDGKTDSFGDRIRFILNIFTKIFYLFY